MMLRKEVQAAEARASASGVGTRTKISSRISSARAGSQGCVRLSSIGGAGEAMAGGRSTAAGVGDRWLEIGRAHV